MINTNSMQRALGVRRTMLLIVYASIKNSAVRTRHGKGDLPARLTARKIRVGHDLSGNFDHLGLYLGPPRGASYAVVGVYSISSQT